MPNQFEPANFTAIADELYQVALREAWGIEATEIMWAREGNTDVAFILAELRKSAALIGSAQKLMAALIPHEAEVRAMLEGTRQ